jgi:hypothetical protein
MKWRDLLFEENILHDLGTQWCQRFPCFTGVYKDGYQKFFCRLDKTAQMVYPYADSMSSRLRQRVSFQKDLMNAFRDAGTRVN